jgi:hypothetical protein
LTDDGASQCDIRSRNRRIGVCHNRRLVTCAPLPSASFLVKKDRGKKNAQDIGLVSGCMDIFSPLLACRTILSTAFFCGERGPHPGAGFYRRGRNVAGVIEHQPKPRIQFAPPPGLGNLHQTA